MLHQGDICHTGSWNSKDKRLCSVVSFGPNSATVRMWEGPDYNKVVPVSFTSGKYLQPVKGGAKSVCAKRILKGKKQMSDTVLKAYLQELQELSREQPKTTKTTLSTAAPDKEDEAMEAAEEAEEAAVEAEEAEEAEEAAEEAFHVIPTWFTEKGKDGDFEHMIKQETYVKNGVFMFNDNVPDLTAFVQHGGGRHPGGGNAIIRPYQHKDKGERAIGFPTGPNFRSLYHVFPSFMDIKVLLTVRETVDLAFAHILAYLLAHPHKNKLYYSAAAGSDQIGLGIFASCTGADVIRYASAIIVKVPEMVKEMRKAKLQVGDARTMHQLLKIVKKKTHRIFVEQPLMLNDTVPPFVYKYLDPALVDRKPGDTFLVPATQAAPRSSLDTSDVYAAAAMIYNKYLDDTKTLPSEWGPAQPSLDPAGYVHHNDYKRCVFIHWKQRETVYELKLVNLVDLAYTEYKKPCPTPMLLLASNMMSNRTIDKFLRGYHNDKDFGDAQVINFAEMIAILRIKEEDEAEAAEGAEAPPPLFPTLSWPRGPRAEAPPPPLSPSWPRAEAPPLSPTDSWPRAEPEEDME